MATKNVKSKSTKRPGARPGDWIYPARRGPVPLPSVDHFNPPAEIAAEFLDLSETVEAMSEAEQASDDGKRAVSRVMRLCYRLLKASVPPEYAAKLADTITLDEAMDIFNRYGADDPDGVTAGK